MHGHNFAGGGGGGLSCLARISTFQQWRAQEFLLGGGTIYSPPPGMIHKVVAHTTSALALLKPLTGGVQGPAK